MPNYQIPVQYTYAEPEYMECCWSAWVKELNGISSDGLTRIKNFWMSGQILLILGDLP